MADATCGATSRGTRSLLFLAALAVVTAGFAPGVPVARAETAVAASGEPGRPLATAVLAALPVKGRAAKTGYRRTQFGPAWADTDRNGCDTRNDVLNRDLAERTWKPGTRSCVVTAGLLTDPYTGGTIRFLKANAGAVQIDHVVALSDAWQKGAQALDASRRQQFANDPLNLLAVDGRANLQKGDGDAATWLPANRPYRCAYVARQVAVKAAYRLWVTAAERDAIANVLRTCAGERTPGPDRPGGAAPSTSLRPTTPPAPPTTTSRPRVTTTVARPVTPPPTASEVYFSNCDAARRAGAAPLRRGQPGYRAGLDRDGDGVACE